MDYETARKAMVDCQVRPSDIVNSRLIEAMLKVEQEVFLPANRRCVAYAGEHLFVGCGRYILDPRTLSKMIDALEVNSKDYILDVGSATGYSTAILSHLSQTIVSVEVAAELVNLAEQNLQTASLCNNVILTCGPLLEGCSEHAPYDAIFVNGAITAKPTALLKQLNPDAGRLVVLQHTDQGSYCVLWRRDGDTFSRQRLFDGSAPILEGGLPEVKFTF